MVSMCLAKFNGMGQQQQQGKMFTGVAYAIAAALLMKISNGHCSDRFSILPLP